MVGGIFGPDDGGSGGIWRRKAQGGEGAKISCGDWDRVMVVLGLSIGPLDGFFARTRYFSLILELVYLLLPFTNSGTNPAESRQR